MDPVSKAQSVAINKQTTGYRLGGATGKGFRPGKSGNPSGRPKRKFATKVYAELFRDPEFRAQFKASVRQIMTAGRGMASVLMAREVAERLEGKVEQAIELTGEIGISEIVTKVRDRKQQLNVIDTNAA